MKNIRFEIYLLFIWIQTYRIVYFSRRLFAKHHTVGFLVAGLDREEIRIKSISKFFLLSIFLKTAFGQTSIHSHCGENLVAIRQD